jgi:hypothetical protein
MKNGATVHDARNGVALRQLGGKSDMEVLVATVKGL